MLIRKAINFAVDIIRKHKYWLIPLICIGLLAQIYGVIWPRLAPISYFKVHLAFAEPTPKSIHDLIPDNATDIKTKSVKSQVCQCDENSDDNTNRFRQISSDSQNISSSYIQRRLNHDSEVIQAKMLLALNQTNAPGFGEEVTSFLLQTNEPSFQVGGTKYLVRYGNARQLIQVLEHFNEKNIGSWFLDDIQYLHSRRNQLDAEYILKKYRGNRYFVTPSSNNLLVIAVEALPKTATLEELIGKDVTSDLDEVEHRSGFGLNRRLLSKLPSQKLNRILKNTLNHPDPQLRAYAADILSKRYGMPGWTLVGLKNI